MKHKAARHIRWSLSLFTLALAQTAAAEDVKEKDKPRDDEFSLASQVIKGDVLGHGSDEEVRIYAGSRSVVKSEDLKKASVRGLDDALQRVPGVKVFDETGTGVLPQISVRGLYESRSGRVQVLSDGIPLSLAPYGQTSLSLFPQSLQTVDRIDIVRGGAAVQYGPNNVGGVINFISKPIPKKWENDIGERITFSPGGHQLYDTYLSTGGHLTDNFGLMLEYNTQNGHYNRDHSNTDVDNVRLRGQWDIDDMRSLSFGLQHYEADMELAGALSVKDYKHDRRDSTRDLDRFKGNTDRVWGTYTQDLGSHGPLEDMEFSLTGFAHDSDRNFLVGLDSKSQFTPDATPAYRQSAPRNFKVWGIEPKVSFSFYGDLVDQTWLVGGRYVSEDTQFDVNKTRLSTNTTTVVRDWSFNTGAGAFFVSDAISLLDGRLTITPGVRHEHVEMSYSDAVSRKGTANTSDEWLPGINAGFQLTDHWFLFADAQRSLRVPQITSIVKGGDVGAEVAWNYEAGFRYTPLANLRFDFNLYRIDFDNQIEYMRTTDTYQNIGKTRHQGFETEMFWTPVAKLDLHAGYAYLDAKQQAGQYRGNEVPFSSKHQFNVDGRYHLNQDWTYALDGLFVSKAFTDTANTKEENAIASVGQLPSYWVWNTSLERRFRFSGDELTTSIGISNLFDRQYYFRGMDTSPWGRQPAPGRTATIAANYRF